MMRNHFPPTSDPEMLHGHRVAALAKSLAAVAVVLVVVGLVTLPERDAWRADSPVASETFAVHAGDSSDVWTASEEPRSGGPTASDEPDLPGVDADKVFDYQTSGHY